MPFYFKWNKVKGNSQKVVDNQSLEPIKGTLKTKLNKIREVTGNSSDVIIHTLTAGNHPEMKIALIYVDGIVDNQTINDFLIQAILKKQEAYKELIQQDALEKMAESVLAIGNISRLTNWEDVFSSLMSGETIILIDQIQGALRADTRGGERRAIDEPTTQPDITGPKVGFTESVGTNTALVRRIIKNTNLWVETLTVGKVTNTDVAIMYVNGIANEKIIKEVRNRIQAIETDSILDSGYIESFIEDAAGSPFPTIFRSERPDVVAGDLLEGKVAVFVDGSPFVILAPAVFIQFFHTADDYYFRADITTGLRILRIIIFIISVYAPAIYIAATTFHQEMIPTQLLIVIAAQREQVPIPAFVEALFMEITFEILREAGVRLPKAVGTAVSIVGAIVIGQAAVDAGIVSAAMVIIVAITAIANFATPDFAMAISLRLLRFGFMVAAALFGIYGIILGSIMLVVHLTSLRSFGVPYTTPLAPFIPRNIGDTFIRVPWWKLNNRPTLIADDKNLTREGENQRPSPPAPRDMNSNAEKEDRNEP